MVDEVEDEGVELELEEAGSRLGGRVGLQLPAQLRQQAAQAPAADGRLRRLREADLLREAEDLNIMLLWLLLSFEGKEGELGRGIWRGRGRRPPT